MAGHCIRESETHLTHLSRHAAKSHECARKQTKIPPIMCRLTWEIKTWNILTYMLHDDSWIGKYIFRQYPVHWPKGCNLYRWTGTGLICGLYRFQGTYSYIVSMEHNYLAICISHAVIPRSIIWWCDLPHLLCNLTRTSKFPPWSWTQGSTNHRQRAKCIIWQKIFQ